MIVRSVDGCGSYVCVCVRVMDGRVWGGCVEGGLAMHHARGAGLQAAVSEAEPHPPLTRTFRMYRRGGRGAGGVRVGVVGEIDYCVWTLLRVIQVRHCGSLE